MPEIPQPKAGRKRWWIFAAGLAAAALLVLVLPIILLMTALEPSCGNDLAKEFPSPNGQLKAVVFRRDCGATTSFTMNVSILPAGQSLPNQPGDAFVKDDDEPPAVHWIDDTHLLISETWPGKILLQKNAVGKVQISYKEGT